MTGTGAGRRDAGRGASPGSRSCCSGWEAPGSVMAAILSAATDDLRPVAGYRTRGVFAEVAEADR
ncbi:hypothetical protein NOCA2210097 [metagenome]|uniref:Uncharacterized protein n=1 Tax=metagenome TaxID=256318 RepID=A0A2P2BYB5_9ZZZZ